MKRRLAAGGILLPGIGILTLFLLLKLPRDAFERPLSERDRVLFFYPRWACGDDPPYVIIEGALPETNALRGKCVYAFVGE